MIAFLFACKKPVRYSDIPEIKKISFTKYQATDTTMGTNLVFYFQDGEGDIGLNQSDSFPPFNRGSIYYYNFFCDYYEKQSGIFVKIDSVEYNGKKTSFNFNSRFPRCSDLPQESINGEISIKIPFYFDKKSPYDTTQIKFYIVDRKLNHSNIETADMIR